MVQTNVSLYFFSCLEELATELAFDQPRMIAEDSPRREDDRLQRSRQRRAKADRSPCTGAGDSGGVARQQQQCSSPLQGQYQESEMGL